MKWRKLEPHEYVDLGDGIIYVHGENELLNDINWKDAEINSLSERESRIVTETVSLAVHNERLDALGEEIEALRADNERLAEALRELCDRYGYHIGGTWDIARAALAAHEGNCG